jgi:hypothetical protein
MASLPSSSIPSSIPLGMPQGMPQAMVTNDPPPTLPLALGGAAL